MGALADLRLTEKQQDFVKWVALGKAPDDAAGRAGYEGEQSKIAWRLLQTPAVAVAIRSEINRLLVTEGLPVAYGALLDLARNCDSPAVRRAAARDLMDRAGVVPPKAQEADAKGEKPLSEMSSDELRGLVDRLEAELGARALPVSAQDNAPPASNRLEFLG